MTPETQWSVCTCRRLEKHWNAGQWLTGPLLIVFEGLVPGLVKNQNQTRLDQLEPVLVFRFFRNQKTVQSPVFLGLIGTTQSPQ